MANVKGRKTTFSSSIDTALYNRLKVKAQSMGSSFSYVLQLTATVGLNVLEGKETKDAVSLAVRDELTPLLDIMQDLMGKAGDDLEKLKELSVLKDNV